MPEDPSKPEADSAPGPAAPAATGRCPWCSAVIETAGLEKCPSCGAHLVEPSGVSVPGVTAIDPGAISRLGSAGRSPGGIVSMISGNDEEVPTPEELPALAPPDEDVRREMLRMQLEAELADLTAEAHAIASERGVSIQQMEAETGVDIPDTLEPPTEEPPKP